MTDTDTPISTIVWLPERLAAVLDERATALGVTRDEVVVRVLEEELAEPRAERATSEGPPSGRR